MKQTEMVGKKFGKLTVEKFSYKSRSGGYYYVCKCDCGKTKTISIHGIRNGMVTSCGCGRQDKAEKEMLGKRFGRLIIEGRKGIDDKSGEFLWICKCDCGQYTNAITSKLKKGRIKSCGCYRLEVMRTSGIGNKYTYKGIDTLIHKSYMNYKAGAERYNRKFPLSEKEFSKIIQKPCIYCGRIDSKHNRKIDEWFNLNGIDRIDSEKGYVKGNVVPCCWNCNQRKSNMPIDKFVDWIKTVYNYYVLHCTDSISNNSLI